MTRAIILLLLATPAFAQERVSIALREHAVVSHRYIRLGDVAILAGGSEVLQTRLAEIDIDDLPADGRTRTCTRTQIEFRLRLAAIPQSLFAVSGAEQVTVVPQRTAVTPARVEEEARQAVYRELGTSPPMRLVKPIVATLPTVAEDDAVALEAKPAGPVNAAGRVLVNVVVRVNNQPRFAVPVYLEAKSEHSPDSGPLVRAGEPVRMVVHIGSINVVAIGEAMQTGKQGEMVSVRNIDSRKVVKGRVTAEKTVQVDSLTP
jgi:hypothetical protein